MSATTGSVNDAGCSGNESAAPRVTAEIPVGSSPEATSQQPSPAASDPVKELIDAAAALVYACCSNVGGVLACQMCGRSAYQGQPIQHAEHCKVGRVIRAATRLKRERGSIPAEVKAKYEAAYKMISALCTPRGCEGHRDWVMSIPARPDYDPDIVIGAALRALWGALEAAYGLPSDAPAGRSKAHGAPELPVRRVPEDDLAAPVESEENWQASEALLRPAASWDHGDFASGGVVEPRRMPLIGERRCTAPVVRVEPAPDRERRRVVCGSAVNAFGFADIDVLTCDLDPGHGDAWHEDSTADCKWPADCFSVVQHMTGTKEYRRLGAKPFFVHPPALADEVAR